MAHFRELPEDEGGITCMLKILIILHNPWDRLKKGKTAHVVNALLIQKVTNSVFKTWSESYNINFQYCGHQRLGTRLVNGDSYVKIKCWKSKGIQEKESIMVVWCG